MKIGKEKRNLIGTKDYFIRLHDRCEYENLKPYHTVDLNSAQEVEEHVQNLDYMIQNLPPTEELQKDSRITSMEMLNSVINGISQVYAKRNLIKRVLENKSRFTNKAAVQDAARIVEAYFLVYPKSK